MQIISVNCARAEALGDGKPTLTGINKLPQAGAVQATPEGLVDDAICNRKHHGGPDQAVYCFSQTDYDWWSNLLKQELVPGIFGENLTVSGPDSATVCVGDRFRAGVVELEVTSPRIPCNTLNRRMQNPRFGQAFREAERPGWYCRVIKPGPLAAGLAWQHVPYDGDRVSMAQMMVDYYNPRVTVATAERYLRIPVHHKTKIKMQALLEKGLEKG